MSSYKISIENIGTDVTVEKKRIKDLAKTVLNEEGVSQAETNIILVDDKYITRLNQEFLNINTTTDVISFNLEDEPGNLLEGEIYANIEQIKRQADYYQVTFIEELYRVLIHGLLHLVGFNDHTVEEKKIMKEKENHYLNVM